MRLAMYQPIDDGTMVWTTDDGLLHVRFDPARRVSNIDYMPGRPFEMSALDNLLWRAKRQWHRWFSE